MVAVADDPTANIVYSQVMRSVPSDRLFRVSAAGVVDVIGNLDREAESTYDVQIQVSKQLPCYMSAIEKAIIKTTPKIFA